MKKKDPRLESRVPIVEGGGTHRIILLSGGIDSTALLADVLHFDLALFVDYGQPSASHEAACSLRMADRFGVPWKKVTVKGFEIGLMGEEPGKEGPRVVQARNACLIALAANQCDGVGGVWIGAHADDNEDYPDCRPRFIHTIGLALGEAYGISVHAPLMSKKRSEIYPMLKQVGIEYSSLWSCYAPTKDGQPCGSCNSCLAGPQ